MKDDIVAVGIFKRTPPTATARRLFVISVVVGAILGVAAVAGFRIGAAVEVFMSQFGLFVVVPAAIGFFAAKRLTAALAATVVLVVMCFIYYLPYANSAISFVLTAAVWTVFSLVAGPIFGLAGNALRTDDQRGVLAAGGIIGLLIGELLRMSQKGLDQGDLDLLSLTLIFDAAAVAAIGAMIRSERLGRVVTYAVPMTVLGYTVTFVLR